MRNAEGHARRKRGQQLGWLWLDDGRSGEHAPISPTPISKVEAGFYNWGKTRTPNRQICSRANSQFPNPNSKFQIQTLLSSSLTPSSTSLAALFKAPFLLFNSLSALIRLRSILRRSVFFPSVVSKVSDQTHSGHSGEPKSSIFSLNLSRSFPTFLDSFEWCV